MSHSPEVLRAFYLIALKKDKNTSESLSKGDEPGIVADIAVPLSENGLPTLRARSSWRQRVNEDTHDPEVDLATEEINTDLEFNLGQREAGVLQFKVFLKNSLAAQNISACQQCHLQGYLCDLQRPSCWKCQRYFLPCYYEYEEAHHGPQIESRLNSDTETTSWQDSVRANPYHNLEGKGKLHRINRKSLKSRRGRLSKPMLRTAKAQDDTKHGLQDEKEPLLKRPSPIPSEANTASRTTSPTGSARSELVHNFSRPNYSRGSGYTTSLASTESRSTGSWPRRSLTIWTTPPTSGGSSAWPPQTDNTGEGNSPENFSCTFCLKSCADRREWELHEQSQHIPKRIWTCMPFGPVEKSDGLDVCVFCGICDPDSDHGSQHAIHDCYDEKSKGQTFMSKDALRQHISTVHTQTEMTPIMQKWSRSPKDNDWYWNCGFCDLLLPKWTDRVVHIGDHFNDGKVMSSWDPLKPSYPLDRTSLNRATWFPPLGWDARALWELARQHRRFPGTDVPQEQNRCQHCDIDMYFGNKADIQDHIDLWHSRRAVWSCPRIQDIKDSILASYVFPTSHQANSPDKDVCPYCNELFVELAEIYPGLDMCDARTRHLEDGHNFNDCDPVFQSTTPSFMLLHLSNIHNVFLSDMTVEVVESCRKEGRTMANKLNISTINSKGPI